MILDKIKPLEISQITENNSIVISSCNNSIWCYAL